MKATGTYIPKNQWVIVALALVIGLAGVSAACGGGGAAGRNLFLAHPDWVLFTGPVGRLAYMIAALTLVTAIIERILETCIAAPRRPERVALELRANNAGRLLKAPGNSKDERYHQDLLEAELTLEAYRMDTRLRTLSAGAVLGACFAAIAGFPVFEVMAKGGTGFHRFIETLVCAALVAGGAEPLHAMLASFQKTIKGYAKKTSQ